MARVTVEDCVLRIPNRFDLVMLAAQRARALTNGAPLSLDRDNDKNPVVALREIADATVSLDALQNDLIKGHQRLVEAEEAPEEVSELMNEPEWSRMSEQERPTDDAGAEEAGVEEAEEEDDEFVEGPSGEELGIEPFEDDGTPFR